jgi:acyl-CoA thioesterase FadM
MYRGEELLCEGYSTLACVDRTGRVQRVPEWLREADENTPQ